MKKNNDDDGRTEGDEMPEELRNMLERSINEAWRKSRLAKADGKKPQVVSTHKLTPELMEMWEEAKTVEEEARKLLVDSQMKRKLFWAEVKDAYDLHGINQLRLSDDNTTVSEIEALPQVDKIDINLKARRVDDELENDEEDNNDEDDETPASKDKDFF